MLTAYIHRALELPPHVAVQKAAQLAGRIVRDRLRRHHDLRVSTFGLEGPSRLVRRMSVAANDVPASLAEALPALTEKYLDHRFDLLGSGWVQVRHGMSANGLEGHRFPKARSLQADPDGHWLAAHVTSANLPEAQRLWRLVEGPYEPIDWQIDFKSGYRWDARRHFRDLAFGTVVGADVKVPWELARLQHLPQLAVAYLLARGNRPGFREPEAYAQEVRNQVIDFLAANPPRFGVNWLCPMDVGIRIANILLSVDLLRASGRVLDAPFEASVARAAAAHARHILANLEWSTTPRSNHYLSDIAGVLFCAIHLPADRETDAWLDFAAQQLGEELIAQFLSDGGNFEGSTNYHRLSTEIGLFSGAALLGVAAERANAFASAARHRLQVRPALGIGKIPTGPLADAPVPLATEAVDRLQAAVLCIAGWMKPNGRSPQVGDTDSGRLFKLHPALVSCRGEPCEDTIDHRALLSAGTALFDQPTFQGTAAGTWFDGVVVGALAGGHKLQSTATASWLPKQDVEGMAKLVARIRALAPAARREIAFELPDLVPAKLQPGFFPKFGLLVLRGGETYLSLRCVADFGHHHLMGHYHDDNLALELYHNGTDLIADPGSYLYTPLRHVRDRYRSARAHFVPRPENRSAAEAISPFAMRFNAAARHIHCGPTGIGAVLEGTGWTAFRAVLIETGRVTVIDGCTPGVLAASEPVRVSEGYGRLSDRMSCASC